MRWTVVLAVCLLGVASQTQSEERFAFARTPGKLPKDVIPSHYALRIAPDVDGRRFDGRAEIDITVQHPVDTITLNAASLEIRAARLHSVGEAATMLSWVLDPVQETLTLKGAAGAIAPGNYRLRIDYLGRIGEHSQGLFRVPYKVHEQGRLVDKAMLATHFEPVHARKLFPGWDEPVFRATFDVSAVVPEPHTAVSNMPVSRVVRLEAGKKEVFFARSVSMPTYLLALFVGEMDVLEDEIDGTALAIYTVRGKSEHARFAMQSTKQVLRHFNDYFGERYLLPKLDQVAMPGGFGGAMENWGAILYNEAVLLLDPVQASLRQQQRIFGIVAHEIAHQWFGNLVTMAWWDNLWLNEGFATWMATRTAERFHPRWRARLRAAQWADDAMAEDARKTTHPIQTPVTDDARAFDLFDAITYTKGEAFLHMLERYLGEETFRDGVRRYMRAHRLSNATTADLWHHLAEASGQDVRAFAAPWVEQPGLPLVEVTQRCDAGRGVVRLEQRRFTLGDPAAPPQVWPVPVILLAGSGEQRGVLLGRPPVEVHLADCHGARLASGGYYRVRYDAKAAQRLVREFPRLSAPERQRLLADALALAQAGEADLRDYLRLLGSLGSEPDRFVLTQVVESLTLLRRLVDPPDERAAFDRFVVSLLREPFARVGWTALPGEDPDWPSLRATLIRSLGLAGDAALRTEARKRFESHATQPLDPAIRAAVLDVVGRGADAETFDRLLAMQRETTAVERRWELQSALRHVSDPVLRLRWWSLLLGDELPPGETIYNLRQAGNDSDSPEAAWQFLLANLEKVYAKASPRGRAYVLPEAASVFADSARADELIELTRLHLDAGARYQAEKSADAIRLAAAVKARHAPTLSEWVRSRGRG